ncbi:MAG: HpcH/HpaI aldolase/citrate lyase family protein [Burkholderiales bacterium]
MPAPIARAYLFVPGSRIERVAKARAALPRGVIVDLEDAVAPTDKETARAAMARELSAGEPVYVRINSPETQWFEDDLDLCARLPLHGVFVPKAEDAQHLQRAAGALPDNVAVIPIVESARGYANVARLCEAPRVQRIAFGTIDFQLDLGIEGEDDELLYFRSGLVLASRLAGLQPPIDGVTVDLNDVEGLRHDTMRGKRLGFGAKLCIHPKQVQTVVDCFRPTAEEIAWAQRIVDVADAAKGAAVAVDGKMVDRPVILKAEEILRGARS